MAGSILTEIGLEKLASATPQNQLNITEIAVGDGDGGFPMLSPTMTALTNERWRGAASNPIRSEDQENVIFFEVNIPENDGGFTIREVAIFDSFGDMIAIGHTLETPKPESNSGSAFTLTVRMFIALSNSDKISLIYQDTNKTHHNSLTNRDAENSHPATAIRSGDGRTVEQRLNDLPTEVSAVVSAEADRAESAADAAALSGDVYATVADGISATTDGDYFNVVSPNDENYLDLYKNDNDTGVYQKSYLSEKGVVSEVLLGTPSPTSLNSVVSESDWFDYNGFVISEDWTANFNNNTTLVKGFKILTLTKLSNDALNARVRLMPLTTPSFFDYSQQKTFCIVLNYKIQKQPGLDVQLLVRWKENGVTVTDNSNNLLGDNTERGQVFTFKPDVTKTITDLYVEIRNGVQGDVVEISYFSIYFGSKGDNPFSKDQLKRELLTINKGYNSYENILSE